MATIEFVGLISPRRSGTQLNWPWASWPKRRPEWYFQVAGWGQGRLRATRPIFRNGDKHGRRGADTGNRRYAFEAMGKSSHGGSITRSRCLRVIGKLAETGKISCSGGSLRRWK